MTPDDARSIGLHLAARPPMAVLLSGFGEPTLHGDLPGIAGALRTHYRGLIGVVTNAERLTPALAGALLDAGVGFFHISVAAACAATVGRIAPGLDFAQSTAHIEALLARAGRTTPIAVNLVLTPENRRERDAIIDRWHSRGACAVYAAPRHSRGGALYRPVARERAACWVFTRTLFAAWNGRVLACCHDVAGTGDYGNLALEPIARITPRRAARMRYTLGSAMCRRCDFPLTDAPATGAANAAAFAP